MSKQPELYISVDVEASGPIPGGNPDATEQAEIFSRMMK